MHDLQTRLKSRFPLYAGGLVTDGVFGPKTKAAVQEFQRRSNLAATGDATTWAKLGF